MRHARCNALALTRTLYLNSDYSPFTRGLTGGYGPVSDSLARLAQPSLDMLRMDMTRRGHVLGKATSRSSRLSWRYLTGVSLFFLTFHMRATHGELIARLVCKSCVHGVTKLMSSDEVVPRRHCSRGRFQIGCPLAVDAMVKRSLGTLLGGRRKISIIDITRI